MKNLKQKSSKFILKTLEMIAVKNAKADCRGFMYEPNIPKKLSRKSKFEK